MGLSTTVQEEAQLGVGVRVGGSVGLAADVEVELRAGVGVSVEEVSVGVTVDVSVEVMEPAGAVGDDVSRGATGEPPGELLAPQACTGAKAGEPSHASSKQVPPIARAKRATLGNRVSVIVEVVIAMLRLSSACWLAWFLLSLCTTL